VGAANCGGAATFFRAAGAAFFGSDTGVNCEKVGIFGKVKEADFLGGFSLGVVTFFATGGMGVGFGGAGFVATTGFCAGTVNTGIVGAANTGGAATFFGAAGAFFGSTIGVDSEKVGIFGIVKEADFLGGDSLGVVAFFAAGGTGVGFGGAGFAGVGTLKTGIVGTGGLGFVATGFVGDANTGRSAFIDDRVSTELGLSSVAERENGVGIAETARSSAPLPVIGAVICFCNLLTA
jgi:hypothetical protein